MNKKVTLIMILLMVLSSFAGLLNVTSENALAKTPITHNIKKDDTWTTSEDPYMINEPILVESQANLTIKPGVKVEFKEETSLTVKGDLYAKGKESNPILFTSKEGDSPGDWDTIEFTGEENKDFYIFQRKISRRIFLSRFRFCRIVWVLFMIF